jgi:putative hydrolase of the HAD superfamily
VKAVVLDFGAPVVVSPWELLHRLDRPVRWPGPWGEDPLYAAAPDDKAYWASRAAELGLPDERALIRLLFEGPDEGELIRPQAWNLATAARAAGIAVAVLSNDLGNYHPPEWIERISWLREVDVLVDSYETGVRKPDPAAYRAVLDRLGVAAPDALFVDDLERNCAGARAVGMPALRFDVTDPAGSYTAIRRRLGLAA